jgi:RNA polymerase sigma-70 factor, ECF subfamily
MAESARSRSSYHPVSAQSTARNSPHDLQITLRNAVTERVRAASPTFERGKIQRRWNSADLEFKAMDYNRFHSDHPRSSLTTAKVSAAAVLSACLEAGTQKAWTDFVQMFQPLIASVIVRIIRRHGELDRSLADDLVQETYLRLCRGNCKALRSFEHRHEDSIFGFVKVVAASVAMDYYRARTAEKRSGEVPSRIEDDFSGVPAPSADPVGSVLMSEISSHLERISQSDRDRAIFWLYYQQGYTAKDISQIPGIHLTAKGVESSLLRLTQAIRRHLNPRSATNDRRDEGLSPSFPVGE